MTKLLKITLKQSCFLAGYCLLHGILNAQNSSIQQYSAKPPLDTTDLFSWPAIAPAPTPAVSHNGKYVLYWVDNMPAGSNTLVVQSINSTWQKKLEGIGEAKFTADSRKLLYKLPGDTLCLLTLGSNHCDKIPGVQSYSLFTQGRSESLAMKNAKQNKLVLRSLSTQGEKVYEDVARHWISEDGSVLVVQSPPDKADQHIALRWIDLLNRTEKEIWKGKQLGDLKIQGSKRMAFFSFANESKKSLWLYKAGESNAFALQASHSSAEELGMEIASLDRFTKDGQRLFVKIKPMPNVRKKTKVVPINVWSYMDSKLQPQQINELREQEESYLAVVNTENGGKIRRLEMDSERLGISTDEYILAVSVRGARSEWYWNKASAQTTYLVSTITGQRIKLPQLKNAEISPSSKYVVSSGMKDGWGMDVYVHEIATGITRNVTQSISRNIPVEGDFPDSRNNRGLFLAGWLKNDESMLVYDHYDIWLVDPQCKKSPLNLTNGRNTNRVYVLARLSGFEARDIDSGKPILLSVFDKKSKNAGFCWLHLNSNKGLSIHFLADASFSEGNLEHRAWVTKAANVDIYLVKKETAFESPNIFLTKDFKQFMQVSSVCPEKKVNWMTSELLEFKTAQGVETQAVLYKPENFDPSKKYPLIIHYYQKKSDQLNKYQSPRVGNGAALEIAWFAGRGYLVCLTDINYTIGSPGESALQAVEGAATHLSKKHYVDSRKMAIQGHSFGGWETNYIITHSKLFAAGMSSCGVSNVTSDAGNMWFNGNGDSKFEYWESRDGRIGVTPWEKPDLYVKNSPIHFVGNVIAPLLLMANRKDHNVYFEEGLQFFIALRRAGKRAWMLEYDNGGHGLFTKPEYKDYLLRMTQFFDHYLKGAPAPRWMLYGIPAKDKGYEDGMDLVMEKDANGKWVTPPEGGLLHDEEKKRVAELQNKKAVDAGRVEENLEVVDDTYN